MFDVQDPIYLLLIEAKQRLEKNYNESYSKASQMDKIPGYTFKLEFLEALTNEYREMKAELEKRIDRRIEDLKK